jgi:hypothetical protein
MTPPAFGAAVRIRHTDKHGTFAGVVDRKHGRVAFGSARRTYPLNDIITVLAAGDGEAVRHAAGVVK